MSWIQDNWDEFFQKYSDDELLRSCRTFQRGKGDLSLFLRHFFEEEIYSCSTRRGGFVSPIEFLSDDRNVQWMFEKMKKKPRMYTSLDVGEVKTFLQTYTSKGRKVANFPAQQAVDIYI